MTMKSTVMMMVIMMEVDVFNLDISIDSNSVDSKRRHSVVKMAHVAAVD